jgi:hypothetical protein
LAHLSSGSGRKGRSLVSVDGHELDRYHAAQTASPPAATVRAHQIDSFRTGLLHQPPRELLRLLVVELHGLDLLGRDPTFPPGSRSACQARPPPVIGHSLDRARQPHLARDIPYHLEHSARPPQPSEMT